MEYKIQSVLRQAGRVFEVVATYGFVEITFQKSPTGKITKSKRSIAPPEKKLVSLYLPSTVYAKLKCQIETIFSSKNSKCKKPVIDEVFSVYNSKKMLNEAWAYNRQIKFVELFQKKKKPDTELKIFISSIKEQAYSMGEYPYLHPNELWHFENLRRLGIKLLRYGVLSFSRTDRTVTRELKLQLVLDDLDTAIRMQQHILDRYLGKVEEMAGEIDRLGELKSLAKQIHGLAISWKKTITNTSTEPEDILSKIKDLAEKIAHDLTRCRNPHKKQALEQAEQLTEPHDSLDRTNPGAQAARVTALLARLAKRVNELEKIVPIILKRKLALEAKKENIRTCFIEASEQLEIVSTEWSNGQLAFEQLHTKLAQVLYVLGQASVLPFLAQANQAVYFLKAARSNRFTTEQVSEFIRQAKTILVDRPFD